MFLSRVEPRQKSRHARCTISAPARLVCGRLVACSRKGLPGPVDEGEELLIQRLRESASSAISMRSSTLVSVRMGSCRRGSTGELLLLLLLLMLVLLLLSWWSSSCGVTSGSRSPQ